jgi:hypothetical protein
MCTLSSAPHHVKTTTRDASSGKAPVLCSLQWCQWRPLDVISTLYRADAVHRQAWNMRTALAWPLDADPCEPAMQDTENSCNLVSMHWVAGVVHKLLRTPSSGSSVTPQGPQPPLQCSSHPRRCASTCWAGVRRGSQGHSLGHVALQARSFISRPGHCRQRRQRGSFI